ncbi:hypothetical protein Taro_034608 [Colocasia esculenta]|uniref:ALOG domain-containing protein n=1 Tax=Colocasia esculenta TaxID=4460 RepID=A0A843WAJ8_COLES|nr:hypothetical protein [Colocasia esculenta]
MEDNPDASASGSGSGEPPSSSSLALAPSDHPPQQPLSRYESQKRRDWNTFLQYLRNHKPPLALARCSGAHVIEFLKYLDQFGKTKVHAAACPFFGHPNPPASCACPLKQAWGSLDALIGRLRAAYEENGGRPENNPFGARAVRIYLREVREGQAKARGIPYEKKRRRRLPPQPAVSGAASSSSPAPAGPVDAAAGAVGSAGTTAPAASDTGAAEASSAPRGSATS